MPDYSKIQVVFFDAGGTLFEVRGSVGEIYSRFARRHGVEIEAVKIHQNFLQSFREQPPLAFPPGTPEAELQKLEYEWWRNLASAVFDEYDFPSFDQFFADVFEFFRGSDAWLLYGDVKPTLRALKNRGLRLAVISNFDSRLDDLLHAFDLDQYFDAVHISSRIGAAKPDPIIFRAALDHHRIEPHRALHVGDSLREDVEGAAAVGIRPILIDRCREIENRGVVTRINRLDHLVAG